MVLNVYKHEKCAICRNWYDPVNAALRPVSPKNGKWECDAKEERVCKVRNVKVAANGLCRYFQSKEI